MTDDRVTAEQLYEHLQAVMRDSEALLKATATYADDKLQGIRARAEASLTGARERLADVRAEALGKTRDFMDGGATYVRENPWQSLGIAAATGLLIGVLLTRR